MFTNTMSISIYSSNVRMGNLCGSTFIYVQVHDTAEIIKKKKQSRQYFSDKL